MAHLPPSMGPFASMADITAEFVAAYLADKWGETARVDALERYERGISRESWFITAGRAAGSAELLVLRRDLAGNSVGPGPLRFEYDVYRKLRGTGVPVAETLWWEEDNAWAPAGRPFYVRRQVEGSWRIPHYSDPDPKYDPLRVEIGREHVRKLALVHQCDWRKLGFDEILPVPASERDCAPLAIARMYADLASFQFSPLPIVAEVREWLLDNAPAAPRICILKGTNGLGEEVFRDNIIVAMSDWEQASLGDPAADFARTQDFFQEIVMDGRCIWGMQAALDYHAELTGVRIPLTSVEYYRVLTIVENVISLHHGALPVVQRKDLSVRLSWLATEVVFIGHRIMLDALSRRPASAGIPSH
jgi:aminoglycoside phosphotransferase (APT) family kinase protein